MNVLAVDIGNTSAKLGLQADGSFLAVRRKESRDWETWLREAVALCRPDVCIVSNVAGRAALPEGWEKLLPCRTFYVGTTLAEATCGLCEIPVGLGADRLAAIVGARDVCGGYPLLVADAGTCLTFDMVDADGRYVGGNISPGLRLRLLAMHEHTAALPCVETRGEAPVLGYDTPTAMRSGALRGLRYEMEGCARMVRRRFPDLRFIVTGGDAPELDADLAPYVVKDPQLVLRGLGVIGRRLLEAGKAAMPVLGR